jgi:hypothetical protein
MSEDRFTLSRAELDAEAGALLPEKQAMSLLDVTVDLDLALDLAAPIDAAIAANANAAIPVDAAVSANILSLDSTALASAPQQSGVVQTLNGIATATAIQDATVDQAGA